MSEPKSIRAVVLDVEGTTTPIEFVYSVLFPYAHRRIESFLSERWSDPEVRVAVAELAALRTSEAPDAPEAAGVDGEVSATTAAAFARWLMDRDRKVTPLKTLQGIIWEEGYRAGDLHATVFPDVAPAFERWNRSAVRIASYSSGSVRAQQLLYRFTDSGDLTPYIEAYFDTTTGAKADPSSFARIADALSVDPAHVLFVSDVTSELEAARSSGMDTILADRPGNRPQDRAEEFVRVASFDEILPAV